MSSFLILLLIAVCVAVFIWLLHKNQRRRMLDTVERTAPLPALGKELAHFDGTPMATANATAPTITNDSAATDAPATDASATDASAADAPAADTWLVRIKLLREAGNAGKALGLCRAHFPRAQALQQAAIILRQQIRDSLDHGQPADSLLTELFRTAVLADLFRNGNPQKPLDAAAALASVQDLEFPYHEIGHGQLKLLNKSDVRALERTWGSPLAHRHGEEVLGPAWLALCDGGHAQQ